jgi:hypothetical protein
MGILGGLPSAMIMSELEEDRLDPNGVSIVEAISRNI